jgi:hypothetical protein
MVLTKKAFRRGFLPHRLSLSGAPPLGEIATADLPYRRIFIKPRLQSVVIFHGTGCGFRLMGEENLRERARRYRLMATQIVDSKAICALLDLAQEYEATANQAGTQPQNRQDEVSE